MTTHLGCDPGQDDAAMVVLRRHGDVYELRAASWFKRATRSKVRGWLVSTWTPHDGYDESWTASYSEAVSNLVLPAATGADTAVVEGAEFKARKGRQRTPESIAALSVARGRFLQEVAAQVDFDPAEPTVDVWRPVVLRCARNTSGDAAKALAVAWVAGRRVMRRKVPTWSMQSWPDVVDCTSHVAEAVCLAVYGAMTGGAENAARESSH